MGFTNLVVVEYASPVKAGDTCRVKVNFSYQGPQITKTLYAAIGNAGTFGFDEILHGSKAWTIPNSPSLVTYEAWLDISITSALNPDGSPYDLYAKWDGAFPDIISPTYYNVITVTGGTPPPPDEDIRNLIITGYTSPVDIGAVCRVNVRFDYQGPAQTRQLYAAIGNSGWAGFDEILHAVASLSLPLSYTLTSRTATVDITITDAINPAGSPYDIYAKINGAFPAAITPYYNNVITITGGVPPEEFKNLRIIGYTSPVMQGDTCKVDVAFEYQGPAQSRTLYAALGAYGVFGFDEVASKSTTISVPESPSLITYYASVNIGTAAANPESSPYDLYAKIDGAFPVATSPILHNVVTIIGEPTPPDPEIRNLRIVSYTSPVGPGENCVIKVKFDYQGPALGGNVYAAIGSEGFWGFDEVLSNSDSIFVPDTISWAEYEATVTIAITAGLSADNSPYDLYAKITGALPDTISPTLQDVLVVKATAGEPEYQNFRIFDYDSPVAIGDTSRITVKCDYRGPAHTRNMRVAIGKVGFWGFDEIIYRDVTVSFAASESWSEHTFDVTMLIVGVSVENSPYDIYAKLFGLGEDIISPTLVGVLGISGGGPGTGDIVGAITSVVPTVFEAGQPVKVMVSYDAYTDDPQTQLGWQTRVRIQAGSLSGEVIVDHFGPETTQSLQLDLGTMPESSQTGTVVLDGRKSGDEWAVLVSQAVTFNLPGAGNGGGEGFGALGWLALAAVGAMAIAGGGESKPPKKPAGKTKAARKK